MVRKRVQWVEEAKEIEMRQLIDNILPTRGKKHKECVYCIPMWYLGHG
jgi:hypothetical protein